MLPLSLPAGDRGPFSIESVVTFDPEGKGESGCTSFGLAICIFRTEYRLQDDQYGVYLVLYGILCGFVL